MFPCGSGPAASLRGSNSSVAPRAKPGCGRRASPEVPIFRAVCDCQSARRVRISPALIWRFCWRTQIHAMRGNPPYDNNHRATCGPVAYGPVAYGPVAYGPVAYGPVAFGPVACGPVAHGAIGYDPVAHSREPGQPPDPSVGHRRRR